MRKLLILSICALMMGSCVSQKKYNSAKAEALRYENDLMVIERQVDELRTLNNTLVQRLEECETKQMELQKRYERLLTDGSAEATRMLRELEENQRTLERRTQQVEQLEQMLRAREEAIEDLRRKVSNALTGFEGRGLSVTTRDGKVYVSMDEKLLFRSGSYNIDPEGAKAIKELGIVLADNPDIDIMVEGHTDDVPYRAGAQLRDNLDLSAMRATTVTRLLLENEDIAPNRIISAGRGEYLPIAFGKDSDSRAKNRRTEIILSPKLDELLQLMDQ